MKLILTTLSGLILVGLLASALLCAGGVVSGGVNRAVLLAGTILWFIVTPLWMKRA